MTFKLVKQADRRLIPTFEGVATTAEFEALKARHEADKQARIKTHLERLQANPPALDVLLLKHAQALAEIDRLQASLTRTGSAVIDAVWIGEQIGMKNTVARTQGKAAEKTNAIYLKARNWTIEEWKRTKHLYPWGDGYSKSRFADAITKYEDNLQMSRVKFETGIDANPSVIRRDWLKGL